MARQPKKGLDYFPVDISIMKERKLRKVKLKYGYLGFMVYLSLLCIIYEDKGYFIDYGDSKKDDVVWEVLETLQGKFQPTAETIVEIIDDLVACELFSGDLFKSKIITSKRIQSTYYSATVEREAIEVNFDIWLLNESEMTALSKRSVILHNYINRPINEDNRPTNEDNQTENTQSKPKKSKVNKTKVNESKLNSTSSGCTGEVDLKTKDKPKEMFEVYANGDLTLLSTLKEYEQMRKSIKKPLSTDTAKQMIINKLDSLAKDDNILKIKLLEEAILHNWQSVYPLKGNEKTADHKSGSLDINELNNYWDTVPKL